jgi:cephalosporin-C deacetylase-like acetyl esterase
MLRKRYHPSSHAWLGTPGKRVAVSRLAPLLALLLVTSGASLASAAAGSARPRERSDQALVQQAADGSYTIDTRSYHASIGVDGNLHSLRVGETEMIDDRVAISLGAFFYGDGPRKLQTASLMGRSTLSATDGVCTIRYQFRRSDIRITLSNKGRAAIPYFVVLSPEITIIRNMRTGEAAAAASSEDWGDVRVSTQKGAYLDLIGGSRVWGPWLGRQVWEVGKVAPGKPAEITLVTGTGSPPKATLEQLVGARVKVASPGALVPVDNPLLFQVSVENRSDMPLVGLVSLELSASRGDQVIYATQTVQLPPRQAVGADFRASVEAPDFYRAKVTVSAGDRELTKASAAAGYRVAEIVPLPNRPAGFHEFWQRLVADAGEEAPDYRLDFSEERSRDRVEVWVARYASLAGKTIYGWYLLPEASQPRPAILYLSGYGARPIQPPISLAKQGYAVLAIDVRGNPVDRPRAHPFEDYCTVGIESPDTYVYREIVGHALRAVQFLASRPEIDPNRIAVLGVSDGGAIGLMLGALSPRVRAVAADAPMLCDLRLSLRAGAWPYTEIARYAQSDPDHARAVQQTLPYFDLVNFAADIKCPVLLSTGFLDPVSLPSAVYGMFNLMAGPKELRPFPEAGHEGGGLEFWAYKLAWLAKTLNPEPAP